MIFSFSNNLNSRYLLVLPLRTATPSGVRSNRSVAFIILSPKHPDKTYSTKSTSPSLTAARNLSSMLIGLWKEAEKCFPKYSGSMVFDSFGSLKIASSQLQVMLLVKYLNCFLLDIQFLLFTTSRVSFILPVHETDKEVFLKDLSWCSLVTKSLTILSVSISQDSTKLTFHNLH